MMPGRDQRTVRGNGNMGTLWARAPAAGRLEDTRGTDVVSGKGPLNYLSETWS
jgi:hypothetical protein